MHQGFREWLLTKCYLVTVVSLPEGAFIPFGKSVSKTTILGVRKKDESKPEKNKPYKVFLATAKEVGYEVGKKDYKPNQKSDLKIFLDKSKMYFDGISPKKSGRFFISSTRSCLIWISSSKRLRCVKKSLKPPETSSAVNLIGLIFHF